MRGSFRPWLGMVIVASWLSPDDAAAQGPSRAAPRSTIHWSSGFGAGIEASRDIRKAETRWGFDYRVGPPLSFGAELALVRFAGVRDDRAAKTIGVTLLPIARTLRTTRPPSSVFWRGFREDRSGAYVGT